MHKLESVIENETHKILLDFEIRTDHPLPTRRPDLVINNKKKRTSGPHSENKRKGKIDKYLDLA